MPAEARRGRGPVHDTIESMPAFDVDHEIERTMDEPSTEREDDKVSPLRELPAETNYDRDLNEINEYEGIINKDLNDDQIVAELRARVEQMKAKRKEKIEADIKLLEQKDKHYALAKKLGVSHATTQQKEVPIRTQLEQEIAELERKVSAIEAKHELATRPDRIKDYIIDEILEHSPLEAEGRTIILGHTKFLENIIANGFVPGGDEEINRKALKSAVNHELDINHEDLQVLFPGIKYNENGEPLVGLFGKLTNKAAKIKQTEQYQSFKAFLDFGKSIPGLDLNPKKVQARASSSNLTKAALVGTMGLAAAGAFGATENEPAKAQRLTDDTEIPATPRRGAESETLPEVQTRRPIELITARDTDEQPTRSSKRGIDENASVFDFGNEPDRIEVPKFDLGPGPKPRDLSGAFNSAPQKPIKNDAERMLSRGASKATTQEAKVSLTSTKGRRQTKAMEEARAMVEDLRSVSAQAIKTGQDTLDRMTGKTYKAKDTPKGPEKPIRLEGIRGGNITIDEGEDSDTTLGAAEEGFRQGGIQARREIKNDHLDVLGKSAMSKMQLGMKGPLFEKVLGDSIDVDLWTQKLGIGIEDATRLTPPDKRAELSDAIYRIVAKKYSGSELKQLADMARDLRLLFVTRGSTEGVKIVDEFQDTLLETK